MLKSVLLLLACAAGALAQKAEFAFYDEFRAFAQSQRRQNLAITVPEIMARYRTHMIAAGVSPSEIDRRATLVRTRQNELEDDFWNRFFTEGRAIYNTAPNSFLAEVVKGMSPGTALDYAMGEGRNSIYLAKLGWKVAGFDPAAEAVALAQKRAGDLGLKLETATVRDSEYDFGTARFDLILLSWASTTPELIPKLLASLRPGGFVILEAGANWFPQNGLLKLFDSFRIVRYELLMGKSDFFNRSEMEIVRLQARKP